ncbi:MAG: hypothetical protein AAF221_08310 [Pseudomonadota bacterium]
MTPTIELPTVHPRLTILDATDLSNVHGHPATESVLEKPYNEGRRAAFNGREEYENPYTGNTVAWSLWQRGWLDARQ